MEIDNYLDETKDKVVILDWLLLPHTKYFDICGMNILLDIPYEVRKKEQRKEILLQKTIFF